MKVSQNLILEIKEALMSVALYGSIEIYVNEGKVTQITVRKIKKTANLTIQDK